MGVAINVKSLEEVPEIMREFVTAIMKILADLDPEAADKLRP